MYFKGGVVQDKLVYCDYCQGDDYQLWYWVEVVIVDLFEVDIGVDYCGVVGQQIGGVVQCCVGVEGDDKWWQFGEGDQCVVEQVEQQVEYQCCWN